MLGLLSCWEDDASALKNQVCPGSFCWLRVLRFSFHQRKTKNPTIEPMNSMTKSTTYTTDTVSTGADLAASSTLAACAPQKARNSETAERKLRINPPCALIKNFCAALRSAREKCRHRPK